MVLVTLYMVEYADDLAWRCRWTEFVMACVIMIIDNDMI